MNALKDIQGVIFDYGGTIDTNSRHWAEVLWASKATSSVILYVMMHIFSHFCFWFCSIFLYLALRPVDIAMGTMLTCLS